MSGSPQNSDPRQNSHQAKTLFSVAGSGAQEEAFKPMKQSDKSNPSVFQVARIILDRYVTLTIQDNQQHSLWNSLIVVLVWWIVLREKIE